MTVADLRARLGDHYEFREWLAFFEIMTEPPPAKSSDQLLAKVVQLNKLFGGRDLREA